MATAANKSNNHLELVLKVLGALLAVAAICVYFIPEPPPFAPQLVVGDPISACAYPAEDFGPKKVDELALMDGVRPVVFDEFNDWKNAKIAGYGECR